MGLYRPATRADFISYSTDLLTINFGKRCFSDTVLIYTDFVHKIPIFFVIHTDVSGLSEIILDCLGSVDKFAIYMY